MKTAEADAALADIEHASRRTHALAFSANAGPHLILWGIIWVVCNTVTQFQAAWSPAAWGVASLIGAIVGVFLGRGGGRGKPDPRIFATLATYLGLMVALSVVLQVSDPKQGNALVSLLVAASYVLVGVWRSARLAWIGVALASLTLTGWLFVHPWFYLWMGVAGGGALILTGLWMRRL